MNYFVLLLSVLAGVGNSTLLNITGKRSQLTSASSKVLFNGMNFTVVLIGLLIINGGVKAVTGATVLWGIIYGVNTALTNIMSLLSFANGPMNFTVLTVYCIGLLMPTVAGPWLWPDNNPVTMLQWVGVAILVVSLILGLKSSDGAKFSLKWLIYVLTAAVTCGALGIIQQAHQRSEGREEMIMMMIIAFATAAVLTLAFVLILAKRRGERPLREYKPVNYAAAAGSGVCIGFVNTANLYLSGVLPAVIFFPAVNGGVVILLSIVSFAVFKEKLNLRQSIALILGIASLFLVCGVF